MQKPAPITPVAIGEYVEMQDKARYAMFSDGSLRRDPVRVRGKRNVKAAKRKRQAGFVQG